jgi:hypothetical protein
MTGYNEFGRAEFDTVRSPLAELVHKKVVLFSSAKKRFYTMRSTENLVVIDLISTPLLSRDKACAVVPAPPAGCARRSHPKLYIQADRIPCVQAIDCVDRAGVESEVLFSA